MYLRAGPFKSVGGTEGFLKGEGPNSDLFYPIRVYMISGSRGRVSNF